MAKNPSTRWYFNDWMLDIGLRLCSVSARGLWMDMLCIAAAAKRKGYIEGVDGKPVSTCELARITNSPKASVSRWLRELERHGVFSRDEDGTIFNRRMVRQGGKGVRKSNRTPPKSTDRERQANQGDLPGIDVTPLTTLTQEATLPLKDSPLPDKPETLNAAREQEGKEGQVKVEGNPEEARCARLGSAACQTGADPPITRMPARLADRHRDGECDAVPSQAPASDHTPCPGEAATGGMVAAPFLPTNPADLDLDGQNNDNSQQEPAMGSSHGCSPGLAASRPLLGAVAVLAPGPCRRSGKSPALAKPDFVKYELLPTKHGNIFCAHRRFDLFADYSISVELDRETKRPRDPTAFQRAIDAASAFIKRGDWTAPSPFDHAAPLEPLPAAPLDNWTRVHWRDRFAQIVAEARL